MYFFIADISGYTSFMIKNQRDYMHGTLIITELMNALARVVDIPLQIAKLEGDALFLTVTEEQSGAKDLGKKILLFFEVFFDTLSKLKNSIGCTCGGCAHLDQLALKMIAHYGEADIAKIGSFQELSGVDVILVHRLLKNSEKEKCYLLMTQAAYQRLALPKNGRVVERIEKDKDFGEIKAFFYYPASVGIKEENRSIFQKAITEGKLVFANLLVKCGFKKLSTFKNIPRPS